MTTFRRAAAFGLAFLGLIPVLEASLAFSPMSPKINEGLHSSSIPRPQP